MTKYFNIKFGVAVMAMVLMQSCIGLEEDESSILAIGNLKSEREILSGLSPVYREYEKVVVYPHFHQITTFGSDDITTWWAGNKFPLRVFDRFDYGKGENSNIVWLDHSWNGFWKTIYYANNLITALKNSTAPPEIVKGADAEARFMRALSYYNLVRFYGNVPVVLEDSQPTGEEVRATVLENYQVIEKDLLIAATNLPKPNLVKSVGRASNAAANALLADLYLTWGGWPVKDASKYALAAAKAKEVINLNYFKLMAIDKLWLKESQNSLESIFSVQFSESADLRSYFPTAYSFHEARGFSDIYPERQFFSDFPAGPRKDATFSVDIPQRSIVNGKIVTLNPATVTWQKSQRNHPAYKKFTVSENLNLSIQTAGHRSVEIIRYAEVLMIYAEAQARATGGVATGDALEALNQIKRRAMGLNYLSPSATVDAKTATADDIVAERGWEFAGENKRWHDLVRTETVAAVIARRDKAEEVPLAIAASQINSQHYIAPIPNLAIITSKLTQNPEGFKIK